MLTALVKAGGDLAESWDDPRVSKAEAREFLGHRLSYCRNVEWDGRRWWAAAWPAASSAAGAPARAAAATRSAPRPPAGGPRRHAPLGDRACKS